MKTFEKIIFCISSFLILSNLNGNWAQEVWSNQVSGTTTTLNCLQFVNNKGWALGNSGVARHTTNGGTTWAASASGTGNILTDVHFVSETKGWFVGSGGLISTSNDGGLNWTAQTSGTTSQLRAVHFVNANQGWAVGNSGTIRTTIDGGVNWTSQTFPTTNHLLSVFFVSSSQGWVTADTKIFGTVDGGLNWTQQYTGPVNLNSIYFSSLNEGWAVGNNGTILKTTNGGSSWTAQTSGTTETLNSVQFISSTNGWAAGSNGIILRTTDGGATWSPQTSGTTNTLNEIHMESLFQGWAVGAGGTILEYNCTTPAQPSVISGVTSICEGATLSYSVTNESGVTYDWVLPSGWTQTSGGTSNSITVIAGSSSGNITVTPSNGCGSGISRTLLISTTTLPEQPTILGNSSICIGSNQEYTVSNVPGETYYWTFPAGWTQTTGGNTSSVTATVGSSSGNIMVVPTNGCGNGATSMFTVSANIQPTVFSTNVTICEGNTAQLEGSTDVGTINWYDAPTGSTSLGSGTQYTTASLFSDLTLYLEADNNGCINDPRFAVTVTVNPMPNVGLSPGGGSFASLQDNATSYQWIDCNNSNEEILNETEQLFTPTQNGSYAVVVNLNGCIDTSACEIISNVGLDDLSTSNLKLFPNPSTDKFTVEAENGIDQVAIYSMAGELMLMVDFTGTATEELTPQLDPGVYLVKVTDAAGNLHITQWIKL